MRLWQIARAIARRRLRPGLTHDEFWVVIVGDICRTLNSVRRHGGFEHLCGHWPSQNKKACVSELDELVAILTEWKTVLERDPAAGRAPMLNRQPGTT